MNITNPMTLITLSGKVEKLNIPSRDNLRRFQKLYFVFPACLGSRSYMTSAVLPPSQATSALTNRVFSLNILKNSTICWSINLKSPVSSGRSTSAIRLINL